MRSLVFVTGNKNKFEVAKNSLASMDIELIRDDLDTPEIQSTEVEEIASYSAKWAAEKLQKPAAVMDAGYYIEALGGFPGPFIKYVNQWLTAKDLLNLMKDRTNRKVTMKFCLAYCEPGKQPVTFTSNVNGVIVNKELTSEISGSTSIDQVLVLEGTDKVVGVIPRSEMVRYWSTKETYWTDLINYLKNHTED